MLSATAPAHYASVLPPKKRKGRPPKKSGHDVRNEELYAGTITTSNDDFQLPYPANKDQQSSWETFMGSLRPVVGDHEDVTTRTPGSSESHSHPQLPSYDQQIASKTLATFPLRNTSDAIRLLDQDRTPLGSEQSSGADVLGFGSSRQQFFLLREGLLDEATLFRLFRFYLATLHPIMPLIPCERIPTTSEHILTTAGREPHFIAAILVVTTGLLGEHTLHHHLWQRVERLFAEVAIRGTNESLEMIEGLLLLSGMGAPTRKFFATNEIVDVTYRISTKYGPHDGSGFRRSNVLDDGRHGELDTQWLGYLTSADISTEAVRLGYLLGLEQLVMQPDDIEERFVDDRGRGKIVWSCESKLQARVN